MAESLTTGQKTFNQLLLAEHCWSEKKALQMWNNLAQSGLDMGGDDLHASLASANAQLEYCGLEITAVSMKGGSGSGSGRYYAMINKHADDIAKMANKSTMGVSAVNLSRLVLEKLCQDGPTDRATLINLKKDLKDAEASFTLDKAHAVVQALQDEKWIKEMKQQSSSNDDDDDGGRKKKQPKRGSMQALMDLAPRSYMELGYLFVEQFGLDKTELPQQLYFR